MITNPDDMSNGFLDFRYTIFGKLIAGDNVRQEISTTPVTTNSSGEDSQPLTPPKILSVSVVSQTTGGGVLELLAAPGATVGDTYTVTVNDGLGNSQTFQVHIGFSGPLELDVGSTPTGQIDFDSGNPTATAANIQSALLALGLSGTTVTVAANSTPTSLVFTVTFPAAEAAITATTTDLPVTFSNSATSSAATQTLTFDVHRQLRGLRPAQSVGRADQWHGQALCRRRHAGDFHSRGPVGRRLAGRGGRAGSVGHTRRSRRRG